MKFLFVITVLVMMLSATLAKGCVCTADYTPVCGRNGVTYSNKCRMSCAGVKLAHNGKC